MNLIGKVFVVLIFVMSLVFMGCAIAVWSVNRNYYDAINDGTTGYKAKQRQLQDQVNALEQEKANLVDQLAEEEAAKRLALAASEAERQRLSNELAQEQGEQQALRQSIRQQLQELASVQDNLRAWREEIGTLRTQLIAAQTDRDTAFDRVITLTDSVQQAEGELERLQSMQRQLVAQNTRMRDILQDEGLNGALERPAKVDGVVKLVRDNRFVAVNIGRDDGIQVDDTLEAYRGSQYLGRLVVLLAEPDQAVCRIVKSMQKGVIEAGDNVTTQIKVR